MIASIRNIALALAICCLPLAATANEAMLKGAELGKWTQDLDAAKALAAKEKLPLFLHFTGSDWCTYCIQMDKAVFSKPGWIEYAKDKLVLVELDVPQDTSHTTQEYVERNQRLMREFRAPGFPTYIILESDGKTEIGRLGAMPDASVAAFTSNVDQVLKHSDKQVAAFIEKLPAEQGKAYREALTQMRTLNDELQAFESGADLRDEKQIAKLTEMQGKLMKVNQTIRRIETQEKARALPEEAGKALLDAFEKLAAAEQAFHEWLTTIPEANEENQKIYSKHQKDLAELRDQVNRLSSGG